MTPLPCRYETFQGPVVERVAWLGERMALLTVRDDLDAPVIRRILEALDRAAAFYARITGREPRPDRVIEGRIPVTEVAGIGGAAWALLGETGIEIQPAYFDVLYRGVREEGLFDQPLFYELGRNYWHYEKKLDVHPGTVATGYAVFLRFLAMDAAGVRGAPYYGWPFEEFRATVGRLLDVCGQDPALSWSRLLATTPVPLHTFERARAQPITLSSADLVAALFARLAEANGGNVWVERFLRAAEALPPLASHAGICEAIRIAASEAAGRDLSGELARWRWPVRREP